MAANVKIVQRNFEPGTSAIEALMLTAIYAQGVSAEVTILPRPCTVANNEASIRKEIERLGNALVESRPLAGRVFGLRGRPMAKIHVQAISDQIPPPSLIVSPDLVLVSPEEGSS